MTRLNAMQAARYCGLKIGSLKAYIYTRQLPSHKGEGQRKLFFYREELDEWLKQHKAS